MQYTFVGGIAFLADFSVLVALTSLFGLHYLVSATVGFSIGVLVSYRLCVSWVFDYRAVDNRAVELSVFSLIGVVGLIINNLTMYLLTEFVDLVYMQSKLFAAAFVLAFNFTTRRWLLFSPR